MIFAWERAFSPVQLQISLRMLHRSRTDESASIYGSMATPEEAFSQRPALSDSSTCAPRHDEEAFDDTASTVSSDTSSVRRSYNWRFFAPKDGSYFHFFRWLIVGGAKHAKQSEGRLKDNLVDLAQVITSLRHYLDEFDMPEGGGVNDQEKLLREVLRDLYSGGAPVWALDGVMAKVAEGLTGNQQANLMIFPR